MTYQEYLRDKSVYNPSENDPILDRGRHYAPGTLVMLTANSQKPERRAVVVNMNRPHDIEDGDPIRVEVEGIFKAPDSHRGYEPAKGGRVISSLDNATTLATFTRYATVLKLATPPKWKAGDVIDVQFRRGEETYTYVFDGKIFPGRRRDLSVEEINDKWVKGQVTIVRKKD